jgi:hypothetical protein
MEPNQTEINLAKVEALHHELLTGKLPKWYGDGGHASIYNSATDERLNRSVYNLCAKLQAVPDITIYSLEMQMWWRDHQEADKNRLIDETLARKNALAKLSDYEKQLLGLK